ncbi:MAG TPA: MBL fold metallo-hydrolase [Aggregatilineaceae bacterium]|nr:MBL fold metallo-hydrolase [Aggregatilineaceae bacterium]
MQRERVAEDVYVFTSERYAQVTAGVVATSEGVILIDTLLFPDETRQIKAFIETRLAMPVRYVINTHYHADHSYGTFLFPEAMVIAHARCFELLDTRGRAGLEQSKANSSELNDVEIVLPGLVFQSGIFTLTLGAKTLQLWASPGHSPDSIVCLVREDRVLFAADTVMAIPYFVDGDYDDFVMSLEAMQNNTFENIVQGHGDVILRGEIEQKLASDLHYLAALKKHVEAAPRDDIDSMLRTITLERCGKSRTPLSEHVQQLHQANIRVLHRRLGERSATEA